MSIRAPFRCRSFVNRETELATLVDLARAAADGSGSVALVSGEAGIGKTRLAEEFVVRLPAGLDVLRAACFDYAPAPLEPFYKIFDAKRPVLMSSAEPSVAEIGRLLDRRGGSPTAGVDAEDRASRKREMLGGILTAFAHLARQRPVIAIFEDVHWADTATLEALRHVAGEIATLRAFFVLTYRPQIVNDDHASSSFVRAIERFPHVYRLDLGPLSPLGMRRLLEMTTPPESALSAERLAAIGERSDGNPLFAEELLRSALEEASRPNAARFALPTSIESLVVERVTSLDDGATELLETAGLLGRTFDASILSGVLGAPTSRVIAFLREAIDRNLIVELAEPQDHFSFRHALVREYVLRRVIAMQAREMHERIATHLETRPDAAVRAPEIAEHLWSARLLERCRPYAIAAADRFAGLHAYREALRHYEWAIACAPSASDVSVLHERCAQVCCALHAFPKAIEHFRTAIDSVSPQTESDRYVAISVEIAHAMRRIGSTDEALAALASVRELVAHSPERSSNIDVEIALTYTSIEDFERAEPYLAAAEPFAGGFLGRTRYRFLAARSLERFAAGDIAAWREHSSAAIETARALRDPRTIGSALLDRGLQASRIADYDEALDRYRDVLEISGIGLVTYTRLLLADALLNMGDVAGAREQFERVAAGDLSDLTVSIAATYLALELAILADDDEVAERFLSGDLLQVAYATRQPTLFVMLSFGLAEHHFARGRAAEAKHILARAARELPERYNVPMALLSFVALGDAATASRAFEVLRRSSYGGLRTVAMPYLELADAYESRRLGRLAHSRDSAARAAKRFRDLRMPLMEAEALELAERFGESRAICRRLGVARLPRVRRGIDASASGTTLTSREREIADLVRARLTNRAIAERLSISERTVETHVNKIFRKLAVRSRDELVDTSFA